MYIVILTIAAGLWYLPDPAVAQNSGTIRGVIKDQKTGESIPYVNIRLKGTSYGASSDDKGNFSISNIPDGSYDVSASVIGHKTAEAKEIEVRGGDTTNISLALEDQSVQVGEVVVYGASMRNEKLNDAPAAVTVLEPGQIKLNSVSGQVGRLLETQPGIDIVQNGLNDFNINTRGFNSSLSRRLLVLLDGRDLAIAFLGAQEWNGLSVPVEDLGKIELVRGPSSALYGANAFNGVINIQSPRARDILGTKITLAGGELNTIRTDVRYAEARGPFAYKINAGRFQGDTWSVSRRNLPFDYPGFNIFNIEAVNLPTNHVASTYASGRLDYDYKNGAEATIEGGITQVENEVFVTGIGRVQVPKALKPWARMSYASESVYMQFWTAGRSSIEPQLSLSTGLPLDEHSEISQGELQYRHTVLDPKLFFIGGLSIRYQTIDTKGTLMLQPRKDNAEGFYSQVEYQMLPDLKFVGAARVDQSTLHESQFSPKLAAVWTPYANHSFRLTFNKAFQAPNLSERFLFVPVTLINPINNSSTNIAYLGNSDIKVEKITGYEAGYKGIFGDKFYITIDGYYNQLTDFITDLTQGVHPIYGSRAILPGDSIPRDIYSYTNLGKVDEYGFETGVNYYVTDEFMLDWNYAPFGFNIIEKGGETFLPNAPNYKVNAGLTYKNATGLTLNATAKFVPAYDWEAGIYAGKILEYTLFNFAGSYQATRNVSIGLNIANLFDRVHYEIFGGSLLKRRAIASVTITM
ncbi:MAG: TonB-dependent receptor domain-containing protein [Bacteroidota bacterium]